MENCYLFTFSFCFSFSCFFRNDFFARIGYVKMLKGYWCWHWASFIHSKFEEIMHCRNWTDHKGNHASLYSWQTFCFGFGWATCHWSSTTFIAGMRCCWLNCLILFAPQIVWFFFQLNFISNFLSFFFLVIVLVWLIWRNVCGFFSYFCKECMHWGCHSYFRCFFLATKATFLELYFSHLTLSVLVSIQLSDLLIKKKKRKKKRRRKIQLSRLLLNLYLCVLS